MKISNLIGVVLLALFAVLGITWIAQGNSFFLYKFFAPKQAAVERQVFENTPSYQLGMVQELRNYQDQWVTATADQRKAIAAIALHEAQDIPNDQLPSDVQQWLNQIKGGNQ